MMRLLPFAAEMMMARRRIWHQRLGIARNTARDRTSLADMSALIDWAEIDRRLAVITPQGTGLDRHWSCSGRGCSRSGTTYRMKACGSVGGPRQLRRFSGFSTAEPTPERTAFVRFWAELVRRSLDRRSR